MEAILELIKFRKDLGFEFELTCFLLLYFSVGYIVRLDCAFLDKFLSASKKWLTILVPAPPIEMSDARMGFQTSRA